MNTPLILIADDDEEIMKTFDICLRQKGCRFVTAMDASQALSVPHERKPSLIIMDIRMPAGDGLTVMGKWQDL